MCNIKFDLYRIIFICLQINFCELYSSLDVRIMYAIRFIKIQRPLMPFPLLLSLYKIIQNKIEKKEMQRLAYVIPVSELM